MPGLDRPQIPEAPRSGVCQGHEGSARDALHESDETSVRLPANVFRRIQTLRGALVACERDGGGPRQFVQTHGWRICTTTGAEPRQSSRSPSHAQGSSGAEDRARPLALPGGGRISCATGDLHCTRPDLVKCWPGALRDERFFSVAGQGGRGRVDDRFGRRGRPWRRRFGRSPAACLCDARGRHRTFSAGCRFRRPGRGAPPRARHWQRQLQECRAAQERPLGREGDRGRAAAAWLRGDAEAGSDVELDERGLARV